MSCWPSGPAFFSHSSRIWLPTFWNALFMAASGSWIVMPFFCSISFASNWRALDMPQPRDSAFDAASFSAFCWSCGRRESARVLATTAFFGWKALVL